MSNEAQEAKRTVRHFRQIVLWPVQLMPLRETAQIQQHWDVLGTDSPWREVRDEFGDPSQFQVRHYSEFVTFLPHVQRFLYGEGAARGRAGTDSPIRVFRRSDIAQVRVTFPGEEIPLVCEVAHVDLYFFYDIDIVILAVEIAASDIDLTRAQETLYRLGRAYPTHWEADGTGGHCFKRVEWLSADGKVLSVSDYERREKYLAHVCQYRAAEIASHWDFVMRPFVHHHSDDVGTIRFRLVEYHRMPILGYLAMEDERQVTRGDFVRLGLVAGAGDPATLPFSERHLRDFEYRFCYDRYWDETRDVGSRGSRYMCCGHAFILMGDASDRFFADRSVGLLEQFRHQYFLIFLIAHFHKAALLMLSDRLVEALNRLDIEDVESVRRFKRSIRGMKEIFLRFTHRYWFHELSDQPQAKAMYRMCREYLGTDSLYDEVREEIQDMSEYLDSDALRRQANTVVRLTVVTVFGLIGTVTTGLLGMNLISESDAPLWLKLVYFAMVGVPVLWLTFYTMVKSKRLSDFLEALSDERLSARAKLDALLDVWRNRKEERAAR